MINLDDVIRQLGSNAEAFRTLVQTASEDQTRWKPNADTWCMTELMEHIYNEERLDFRRHVLTMFGNPPQPLEWIRVESCHQALDGFEAERAISLAWLRTLQTPDWERTLQLPFGPNETIVITAGAMLASWVEHDYLHLRQLVELLHGWNEQQATPYAVQYAGGW